MEINKDEKVIFFEWIIKNESKLDICINDDSLYYFKKFGVIPNLEEMINYDYKNISIKELLKDFKNVLYK